MPVPACVSFCRFLACALALCCVTQCAALKRFESPTNAERSEGGGRARNADPDESGRAGADASDTPAKTEDGKAERDYRIVGVDQTPFFRWLRSGLRSNAKPTRFLDKGMQVEILQENDEEKFSQVRLPDDRKGWVPSRLVRDRREQGDAEDGENSPDNSDEPNPAGSPSTGDAGSVPVLEPDRLPGAEDGVPPIQEDIGPPLIPGIDIIPPPSAPAPESDPGEEPEPNGEGA